MSTFYSYFLVVVGWLPLPHPNPQRTRGTHHGRPDADRRSVGDAGTPNAGGRSLRTKVADTQRSEAHSRPMSLYFYNHDEPYFEFTNFSNHAIVFDNQQYATAEHLFQAFKFLEHHPNIGQLIRDQPTPRRAREEAGRLRRLQRSDWFDINIEVMDRVLALKFEQHPRLARMLVDTGNAALVEDSPDDVFWGVGKDRLGRNELGKALMRLRSKLATG